MTARRATDVHARIAAECAQIQAAPPNVDGDLLTVYPHALALLESAIAAIENAVPECVEHEGRVYRLRLRLQRLELGIYPDGSSATPMLHLQTEGLRWCGYRPGH